MTLEEILNVMYDAKTSVKGLQLSTKTNVYNLSNIEVLQVSSIWNHPRGGYPQMTYIVLPDKTTIDVNSLIAARKL